MIVLHFQLTEEDHIEFNYYRVWSSPERRNFRIKTYIRYGVLILIASLIVSTLDDRPITLFSVGIAVAIACLFSLVLKPLIRFNLKRHVRKLLADPANAGYTSPTQLTFTGKGIFSKDELSENSYDWNAIVKKTETATHFYLFVSSLLAIAIPKRAFTNAAELESFKKMLLQYVPLKAELKA